MKDTIKAKVGYSVCTVTLANGNTKAVYDGSILLFFCEVRSLKDYIDECENGNNECAVKYDVFTTIRGNQFIYWGDIETCEDFITKVEVMKQ